MTHFIHTQADLETAVGVLIKQDPRWQPVLAKSGMPAIRRREGGYAGLCSIVCGQQLSTASAAAIRARLFAAFEPFHHDTVRLARVDKLARLGLSQPKIKSIKEIGKAIARKHIDLDAVAAMEADQAHAALTALHGIGPWTADIYLLFCLGNADAWPAGELAIGRAWQGLLPDPACASPHAPDPCGQAPVGRQWFPLFPRAPNERWEGVNKAGPVLEHFIEAELARRKLPPSALALVGFSQGTMMALHTGLRRATPPAAIVGYSGIFVLPDKVKPDAVAGEIKGKPPVLLVHGSEDDLIPAQALFQSAQALASLEVPVEWHLSEGVGHGIDQEGLRDG